MSPKIISIAGISGCGKSSIAKIISKGLGESSSLILCSDDLHKYSRKSEMWEILTHLNPAANNIDLGDYHLEELKKRNGIWRSK